jgi:hypothetical protein
LYVDGVHSYVQDGITLKWTATGGTFSSSTGYQPVWTAPMENNKYIVNLRVKDTAVDMGAYEWTPMLTVMDVARAMRITGGMSAATSWDIDRLAKDQPPVVDLRLATLLIRSVTGLD